MSANDIGEILEKSAKSALFSWKQSDDGVDDLVNELWVWYLESPATQKKLGDADEYLARRLVYKAALQILAKKSLSDDRFHGNNLYSSENVKDALLGVSKNLYLLDILPRALEALDKQNPARAEAIRSRYEDGVIPPRQSNGQVQLSKSVRSLTEHVNVIAITAGVGSDGNAKEGPGSRSSVFPETRRAKGYGHSDPTGDMAVLLLENPVDEDGNPLRDEYLHEISLQDLLKGKGGA